jgi:acetyl-CoA carboxylase biotin carboxyl carrier protein
MDIEEIRKLLDELAAFMKKNELAELELDIDGAEVKLKKAGSQVHHQVITSAPLHAAPGPASAASASPAPEAEHPGAIKVVSPMVGTFYRSPKPDAEHFVEVGDEVDEDSVLCIIEAMKVMNEIKAEHKGRIAKIMVENGEPVEYGQPLFLIVAN